MSFCRQMSTDAPYGLLSSLTSPVWHPYLVTFKGTGYFPLRRPLISTCGRIFLTWSISDYLLRSLHIVHVVTHGCRHIFSATFDGNKCKECFILFYCILFRQWATGVTKWTEIKFNAMYAWRGTWRADKRDDKCGNATTWWLFFLRFLLQPSGWKYF